MAAISIQAVRGGTAGTISWALALAAVILVGAGVAQAASDSTDRITPPSAAGIATLRSLLALQHPALRRGGSAHAAPTSVPAVTTEPGKPAGHAPAAATEGEACVTPGTDPAPACGYATETAGRRTATLDDSFRASLDRSMAAAGYGGERL